MPRRQKDNGEQAESIEFIPASELPERKQTFTGVSAIDSTIPFYLGTVYGFAGRPGSGKTRLAYQLAVATVAKYGGVVVIYDYDRTLNKHLLQAIGKRFGIGDILQRVYVPKYSLLHSRQFFETIPSQIQYLMQTHDLRVIIFDTITVARKMLWPGRENLAEAQQVIGSVINRVKSMIDDQLVLVNIQVMQRPDQMGRLEYIGGPTLGHAVEMFFLRHHPNDENKRMLIAYEVSYLSSGTSVAFSICDDGIC